MMKMIITALFFIPALFIFGCAQNVAPDEYSAAEIGAAHKVLKGTIVSLSPVTVHRESGVGTLAGAAAGGAAGSMIGDNTATNVMGAVGGAVVGGLVGSAAESKLYKAKAIEYVVQLRDNNYISVIEAAPPVFNQGQHVLIILGPKAHLIPDPGYAEKPRPKK